MPVYRGSCHCGGVQFQVDADITELYTCDCSLCSKKNALMTNLHESALKVLAGADKLTLYQWNTKIARHYFCSVCGIYPFHRKRSMPDHYGVNVRCLEGLDIAAIPVRAAEGKGMSLVEGNPAGGWSGPKA
ncbi:MAG: GFA family protein [Hyphomonadaceae bacterium]|nr:GFA family protein [Hyphomonadaceae bacterium]